MHAAPCLLTAPGPCVPCLTSACGERQSSDLISLGTLFDEGVHKSDCLVLLATQGVFTRPWWCAGLGARPFRRSASKAHHLAATNVRVRSLLEMFEAATHSVPIVLLPVEGKNFDLDDTRLLLGDLTRQMEERNPYCLTEVMGHVRKKGVTDVRELEDVLLASLGLVPTLERPGRAADSTWFNTRVEARLGRNDVSTWLHMHNRVVEQRLKDAFWQPWGSDHQILASVQVSMPAPSLRMPALGPR